ncbi:Myb domain protein 4r1 [Tanacetum coccineum]
MTSFIDQKYELLQNVDVPTPNMSTNAQIWAAVTGVKLRTLEGHDAPVYSAPDPDDTKFAPYLNPLFPGSKNGGMKGNLAYLAASYQKAKGANYLIKAHPSPEVLYGAVGDHADNAGETAVTFAASSTGNKYSDPGYSTILLKHSKQLSMRLMATTTSIANSSRSRSLSFSTSAGDCGFLASAQAFVEAIKKNRTYQKFLHDKLIKVEARLEENKKLSERVKFLKGFQVDCRKRTGRALSHKKDPRFQLISVPKLRANASKLFRFGDKYRTNNPILLQQHREKMHRAMKDENRRRRKQIGIVTHREEETSISISSLEAQVAKLKKSSPVPVDIFVWPKHRGRAQVSGIRYKNEKEVTTTAFKIALTLHMALSILKFGKDPPQLSKQRSVRRIQGAMCTNASGGAFNAICSSSVKHRRESRHVLSSSTWSQRTSNRNVKTPSARPISNDISASSSARAGNVESIHHRMSTKTTIFTAFSVVLKLGLFWPVPFGPVHYALFLYSSISRIFTTVSYQFPIPHYENSCFQLRYAVPKCA